MVEIHEMVLGKRFDRYHELGQHAFGERLSLNIVVPQQLIWEVSVHRVYDHPEKIPQEVQGCKNIKLTYFIMIFASIHFVLSQLPNFNSISGVSLSAACLVLKQSVLDVPFFWGQLICAA
ncbi:Lysine histidine transporter 1 [Platanthera zijinensis]|uniref:Lysine histidine transporter 1 n=1 Tax=Platanthera zijinensis TaxID=2320716 RepID=A0AAP0BHK3_9ASPA